MVKTIRLILILLVGGFLTYLTYKFKYSSTSEEFIIWLGLISIGLILFIWAFAKDLNLYLQQKRIQNFSLTFISISFIAIILTLEIKNQRIFNIPSLLKVYYDGDFNGTGIDFKINGTYIFDNSAIGFNDCTFGTYKIDGNKISLDREKIDHLNHLKFLEIRKVEIEYSTGHKLEEFLFQVDEKGKLIDPNLGCRIVIDNRKSQQMLK